MPVPTQPLRTTGLDHWMWFLIHDAIRADTVRLAHAVSALDAEDRRTARRLHDWFVAFRGAVELHHHAEDTTFFPAVAERAGVQFSVYDTLDADHHRLDELLEDIESELSVLAAAERHRSSTRARLVTDVVGLRHLVGNHLALEETTVLRLLDEHFDDDENGGLHRQAMATHSLGDLRFSAPWIAAHAKGPTRERLEAESNVTVRLFERLVRGRYERLDAVLPPLD